MINSALKVFTCNSNPSLAKQVCDYLKIPLGDSICKRFSDGEIYLKINENIRGVDVFIVQSTHPPSDNLFELLLMIDAAKRASANRVTAVIPYFGYARQDKKDEPRVPISSKLVANLLATAGADRILTLDLHTDQIQGFFDIPVDHLYATPVVVEYLSNIDLKNFVIVSPDPGGTKRARGLARRLGGLPLAIIDKRRPRPNVSHVVNVVGDVHRKNTLLVDDMIDTAGTITEAAKALKKNGAQKIYAWCTHPVLSGNAKKKLGDSPIEKLFVADTIPLPCKINGLKVLSVAPLLGEAIKRIHNNESVSSLFIE
jgi:ribose-phosphate pyrophosphokinase